jgi:hypothetical protein
MKRRIIVGSIIAIFLMVLVPVTNAIQIQTVEKDLSTSYISYETIKNMDADELIIFIHNLAKDYPQLYEEFQRCVDEMENTPVSSMVTKRLSDTPIAKNQEPQPKSDNQTFIEKIFWKIFNYRTFRLFISTCLFLYFQSKFTLMRTMTWGIKLLRWVKIGILMGFIDPSQQEPTTPDIVFEQDEVNNTLMVVSVSLDNVLWSDINQIGSGSCDPLPIGNVTVGGEITNCSGIIVLQYLPTEVILGVFEFNSTVLF